MNNLYTVEGEKITSIPLIEYPRPTLVRDSYLNLNGKWEFGVCSQNEEPVYDKEILVPFPPESLLSGINKHYPDGTEHHYRRKFSISSDFKKDKVILHFGAIDQCATVYVNDHEVGFHVGGYSAFSFDITEYICNGENAIHIRAVDNLNSLKLPYGKQRENRGGMWYTPVSGVWQTIWLESVPSEYIQNVEFVTKKNNVKITLNDNINATAFIETPKEKLEVEIKNGVGNVKIPEPKYWSPEDPYLYYVTIKSKVDTIKTYFAFRTLSIKEIDGIKRLCLNDKPYFFHGLLDQGYWSDGIYTPASNKCYEDDILTAKKLGFNMLRKHIKTESEIFYYYCDKIGMVVFQDMINNSDYSFIRDTGLPTIGIKKRNDKKLHKNSEERKAFTECTKEIITTLKKHPSICLWTVFNEGWGQFEGNIMYNYVKTLDDTRFIDTASGWFHVSETDVESIHTYFRKYKHKIADKPVILSEFGGYSYKIPDHSFNLKKTYGYGKFKTSEEFQKAVSDLYNFEIIPSVKNGLCASVYTQLSDVEDETNGIMTYDRKVLKINEDTMLPIKESLYNEIKKICDKTQV